MNYVPSRAIGRRAYADRSGPCSAKTNLFHERYEIIKEIFFDDLSVLIPTRDGAEVHFERLAGRFDLRSIGSRHRSSHGSREVRDRAGPIARGEEDAIGTIVEVLIREGLEEIDGLL